MDKALRDAFEVLRQQCGSHTAAAKYLGMTNDHYSALRNGRAGMPKRTAEYIIMKTLEISTPAPPLSSISPKTLENHNILTPEEREMLAGCGEREAGGAGGAK
jgi:hypothetical protein